MNVVNVVNVINNNGEDGPWDSEHSKKADSAKRTLATLLESRGSLLQNGAIPLRKSPTYAITDLVIAAQLASAIQPEQCLATSRCKQVDLVMVEAPF